MKNIQYRVSCSERQYLTIVPLLKNPPDAQKLSVMSFNAVAVLVRKFQREAQAGAPSIINGSFVALSMKIANVGDTTIASKANTPLVPFWTNSHFGVAAKATPANVNIFERKTGIRRIVLRKEGRISQGKDSLKRSNLYLSDGRGCQYHFRLQNGVPTPCLARITDEVEHEDGRPSSCSSHLWKLHTAGPKNCSPGSRVCVLQCKEVDFLPEVVLKIFRLTET